MTARDTEPSSFMICMYVLLARLYLAAFTLADRIRERRRIAA